MTNPRAPRSAASGKVRVARLTDLAALGELSRLCQSDGAETRSLGLPVNGPPIGVFSLFRLPLGAFQPHDIMYVYEEAGRLSGLIRVERDTVRDEWTIVELDGIGTGQAGDIRFRLVNQVLRDAAKRGPWRIHVACTDQDGNVELFMQAGFARYGDEWILHRPRDQALPETWTEREMQDCRIRPATSLDALPIARLYAAATPQPVQRLEGIRLPDWERQGTNWRVPRSSLAPILRFADVEVFVQESRDGGKDGTALDGFAQIGVAMEDQPHYLKLLGRPDADMSSLASFALGVIRARTERDASRRDHG
ncbi:MAG TPA: hypothetical protein VK194_01955, partial [Candidatus Deferrimicrobium sp.]|nr:hypothetical protein [Candidatus Deferrimicrobium sp.]